MRVITLSFTSSAEPLLRRKQQLTWNELFSTPNYSKTINLAGRTIDINFVDNLLLIETNAAINVFMNLDAAPLVGIYVSTNGNFAFKGALSLDLGMLVLAASIKIDGTIMSPRAIGLSTSVNPNGTIAINKKIMIKKIGIFTNTFQNSAHIYADQCLVHCKKFIQNEHSCLAIGNPITLKHEHPTLRAANSNALELWNNIITQPIAENLLQEVRYIHADKLINKSELKLRNTELHIKDILDHCANSKTTYQNVRIFNNGITHVAEFATINGANTFLQSDQSVDIAGGVVTLDKLALVTKTLNVSGILDGGKNLEIQVAGYTTCNGIITAEHAHLVSNQILVTLIKNNIHSVLGLFSKGGISGKKTLRIHSLATVVAGGGYLYSPTLSIRSGIFANLAGIIYTYNIIEKTIFSFGLGLTVPCAPNSRSELVNPEKLLRLATRIMGSSFPVLQGAATLGSLATQAGIVALDAATAVYQNPAKQAQKVADNLAYVAATMSAGITAAGSGAINTGKSFYKEPITQMSNTANSLKSALLQVSESWNRMRMIDWLDFVLTAHDWYIYCDMIAYKGTNCLVFAHETKIGLQNPSVALEKIKNNLTTLINNVNSAILSPNFAKNLGNAIGAELNKVIAAPIKAVEKIASQLEFVGTTLSNPEKNANDLVKNATYALNTIDLTRAANDITKKWSDKANAIVYFGNAITATDPIATDTPPQITTNTHPEQACARDVLLDAAMIFGPSVDRRSLLSADLGITISGSVMEEGMLSSYHGVTMAIGTSTNVLFGYHNSGLIYSNYRTEFIGNRYNTGDIYANTMHLEATNNAEHGHLQVSKRFVFDIKNNFTLAKDAQISFPKNTRGSIQGDFFGYGDMQLYGGKINTNKYVIAAGANHIIADGASFYANEAYIQGNLTVTQAAPNFKNAIVRKNASYANHNAVQQGEVLIFESGANCDLKNDIINVSKLIDEGANINVENHVTIASEISRAGQWQYKGFLHEDANSINSTIESSLKNVDATANGVYSLHAKNIDLHGQEQHSRIMAAIDEIATDDLVNYALGAGKYAGITVTDSISIYSKTTETITYTGDRANGARVQIQTDGAVVLPAKFARARDLTFASYIEADIFVRTVYDSYNLPPPPPPPIKRHGIKKYLGEVSNFFATAAAAFAGGGLNPVTMAASALCSAAAYGIDQADKHYDRKESRELERRELESLRLRQKSSDAALSLQEQHALAQLEFAEHHELINQKIQQFNINAGTSTHVELAATILEKKQNLLQEIATKKGTVNAEYAQSMKNVAYAHARNRDNISKHGGPVIGVGVAVQLGTTGVSTYATVTAGNPGQTTTGKLLLTSYDFNRNAERHVYIEQFTRVPPIITEISEDIDEIVPALPLPFSAVTIRDSETELFLNGYNKPEENQKSIKSAINLQNNSIVPYQASPKKQTTPANIDNPPKSTFGKIVDFWQDLDDGMQATEYYERPSVGTYEVKVLSGAAVGILSVAVYLPFQFVNKISASAEEFDCIFNPEILTSTYEHDRQRLLDKYQIQHDAMVNGLTPVKNTLIIATKAIQSAFAVPFHLAATMDEFDRIFNPEILTATYEDDRRKLLYKYQAQHDAASHALSQLRYNMVTVPLTTVYTEAHNFGKMIFGLAATSEEQAFATGMRLGTTAMNSRYMFFTAQSTALMAKRAIYSEYRMPIVYTKQHGYELRTFMRPKGVYLEPTTQLPGFGIKDFLSKFDLRTPVSLTWEERDMVAYYMVKRFSQLKELESFNLSIFTKDLKPQSLLKKAISQVQDHMKPGDLCAHLKEKRGIIIFGRGGKRSNHPKEYTDAGKSMENIQNLKRIRLTEKEAEILNNARPILSEAWNIYEELREIAKLDKNKRIKMKNLE